MNRHQLKHSHSLKDIPIFSLKSKKTVTPPKVSTAMDNALELFTSPYEKKSIVPTDSKAALKPPLVDKKSLSTMSQSPPKTDASKTNKGQKGDPLGEILQRQQTHQQEIIQMQHQQMQHQLQQQYLVITIGVANCSQIYTIVKQILCII
jgi:hypothetical protein